MTDTGTASFRILLAFAARLSEWLTMTSEMADRQNSAGEHPLEAVSAGQSPQWRRWTIIIPGAIGAALGAVLGTLGFFGIAFGQGTVCTDFNEAPHACDALYSWLEVGFIGQWVLVLVSAFLLAFGLRRPQSRMPASIAAWITLALTTGWYGFYFHGAYHSFRIHH